MNERKTESINLRMSPGMKRLLRRAAEKEHRTLSNMLEMLILNYCKKNGITGPDIDRNPSHDEGKPD
ncbi:hypothetical protein [Spongiibacter sp. IMCC21906]|uniref:type II toxin -antitoxin system TacA 1-like antitoxin n=1 Tax=Spongiibacter sp. IMCC21906 TaxID=1620392 RepID=UPI00062E4101|nr:hypothetical protein [Spongiibacter sp. IMCC21906]